VTPRPDLHGQRGRLVAYVPWLCPSCRGRPRRGATSGPHGPLRYHLCGSCGTRYRSRELDLQELRGWDLEARPPAGPDGLAVVPYLPVRCPNCRSKDAFTYGALPWLRMRYHRCRECRGHFRSLELDAAEALTFNGAEPGP